jgi:hypothetical protein
MIKASIVRRDYDYGTVCRPNVYHSFIPYSTETRTTQSLKEIETVTALICSTCLLLVGFDDQYHQMMSDISAVHSDQAD